MAPSRGSTDAMSCPSRCRHRYSSPAHSAMIGIPSAARRRMSSCRLVLADSSVACTSGNPPPRYSPQQPCGRAGAVSGSTSTTSNPLASSSSAVSGYRKVKARPPAMATTGRPVAPVGRACPGWWGAGCREALEAGVRSGDTPGISMPVPANAAAGSQGWASSCGAASAMCSRAARSTWPPMNCANCST